MSSEGIVAAEQAVLGSLLIDEDALQKIHPELTAQHFRRPSHRIIYAVITALAAEGKAHDPVTVAARLDGKLEEAGGLGYLSQLARETPTAQNVDTYAAFLRERAEPKEAAAANPFDWLKDHEMTDAEAQQIADAAFIEPDLVVEGHMVAIVAPANGGKTTIIFHLSCRWSQLGYHVVYVHADTNPTDAKRMREEAQKHGVRYLTPDLKVGKSMADVVLELKRLAESDADLGGWVFIFDTLKKMTNVINKGALRELLALLRKLSARGMTVIVLAHTNKYKNADGEYQYEGTADLLNDVDELIYFEPRKNPDGSLTVSTRKAKVRALINPRSWDIAPPPALTVTARQDYVDVAAEARAKQQREEDAPVIEAISGCLCTGPKKQTEVIQHCQPMKFSEKRVRKVLLTYDGDLWKSQRLFQKNAWQYSLLTEHHKDIPI